MVKNTLHQIDSSELHQTNPKTENKNPNHDEDTITDPTESVSGEGEEVTVIEHDLFENGSEGTQNEGEIESVIGYDPSDAYDEGKQKEILTDELLTLKDAGVLEGHPEDVCGTDDRVKVCPAVNYPFSAVCKLIITRADGLKSGCTGWFIGPHTVITSGHCVYSHGAGGWARQIEVIPAICNTSRPYGSQISRSFRSVIGWTRDQNSDYDYGAIILPNDTLGNRVGWFGFASLSTDTLRNMLVNNSGYPGDKHNNGHPFSQWFNAGRISQVTSRKLYYNIDTYGGQSGSPIWRFQNNQRHGVGIHGYGGCPNKAIRIINDVFNNLFDWKR